MRYKVKYVYMLYAIDNKVTLGRSTSSSSATTAGGHQLESFANVTATSRHSCEMCIAFVCHLCVRVQTIHPIKHSATDLATKRLARVRVFVVVVYFRATLMQ